LEFEDFLGELEELEHTSEVLVARCDGGPMIKIYGTL
jgi:hypothetical protein